MSTARFHSLALTLVSLALGAGAWRGAAADADAAPAVGQTRVARWQDDRVAVFLLMFDDSWPSHFQVAAPELVKRGMIATFYVCPGKGEYQKFPEQWERALPKQGMVYGDHTMTHRGVTDDANAQWEIGECARVIRKITPGKDPRLVSYGQPGVKAEDWKLAPARLNEILAEHHLIDRPTFVGHGANLHVKTPAEMLALADKAIRAKGMEYLVIHGVERVEPNWGYQDFWALRQDVLRAVLDGLKERRDKGDLWITDHISQHQYEQERDGATAKTLEAGDRVIRVELTSTADPKFYDLPLTLLTRVPAAWRQAKVGQAGRSATVEVRDGTARYQALPNGGPVTLEPG